MTEKAEAVNLHLIDDVIFFEEGGAGGTDLDRSGKFRAAFLRLPHVPDEPLRPGSRQKKRKPFKVMVLSLKLLS